MTPPDGSASDVQVGNREIFDAIVELKVLVAPLTPAVADHEARLRILEQKIWRFSGVAAAAGAVGGVVIPRLLGS